MTRKNNIVLLVLILIVGIFVRVYQFGSVPNGLYQDELAIGYNAYSIIETGKDEHGNDFPLYFTSFGDYKLPVYIYSTSLVFSLFGVSDVGIRITSLVWGILSIYLMYVLGRKWFNEWVGVSAGLLLSINPWHIFFSRAALEVNVATGLALSGIVAFVYAAERRKIMLYILSIILFALSLYTYSVSRLIAPLLFILMLYVYRKEFRSLSKNSILLLLVFAIFCAIPFVYTFIVGNATASKQYYEMVFGGESLARSIEFRSYTTDLPRFVSMVLFNKWVLSVWEYMRNIVRYLSVDFFFLHGNREGHFGIENVGMFHIAELVTIIVGAVYLIKNKSKGALVTLGWVLIMVFVVSINKITPHATRSYMIVAPLTIVSGVGLYSLINWIQKKSKLFKMAALFLVVIVFSYSFFYFLASYFYRFPVHFAYRWRSEDQELARYLEQEKNNYDKILIDNKADFSYASLLYYLRLDPETFHADSNYVPDGQLLRMTNTGPYYFEEVDWEYEGQNVLIVSKQDSAPEGFEKVHTLYYPTRPVVLFYDGKIGQFPTDDIAYEIYRKTQE